jgi:hypothetical protein
VEARAPAAADGFAVTELLLLDRLRESDLAILAQAAREPGSAPDGVDRLRADPRRIDALLGRPEVFEALFGRAQRDPLLVAAPFLAFAVLVARAHSVLGETSFVREWIGPERRLPVFDADALREFLEDPARRLFLADVLASYVHVGSGSVLVKTARGFRRRKFSELDPMCLIELIQASPERDRALLWRRLGDLSLFLTGVFPDYASRRLLAPPVAGRLRRAVADAGGGGRASFVPGDADGSLSLLETIGRRAYREAWEATEPRRSGMATALREISERFGHARRILNFLTERYLFPFRDQWFAPTSG